MNRDTTKRPTQFCPASLSGGSHLLEMARALPNRHTEPTQLMVGTYTSGWVVRLKVWLHDHERRIHGPLELNPKLTCGDPSVG